MKLLCPVGRQKSAFNFISSSNATNQEIFCQFYCFWHHKTLYHSICRYSLHHTLRNRTHTLHAQKFYCKQNHDSRENTQTKSDFHPLMPIQNSGQRDFYPSQKAHVRTGHCSHQSKLLRDTVSFVVFEFARMNKYA